MPRIDQTLESLAGAEYFCTTDLTAGYHQVPMRVAYHVRSSERLIPLKPETLRGDPWAWTGGNPELLPSILCQNLGRQPEAKTL